MLLARDRALSALLSVAFTGLFGYALIVGLGVSLPSRPDSALRLFDLTAPLPLPERAVPPPRPSTKPEGRAAPPNLRARPKEVVAPPPLVPLPIPPVLVAAPVADVGPAPRSGATDRPGPGTGAGGQGDGRGAGGAGDDEGGGIAVPLRRIRGEMRDSDYPRAAREAGIEGEVHFRFLVDVDGRPKNCVVTRSSGSAALDETTCRVFLTRFRYRPSLNGAGRPVRDHVAGIQGWSLGEDPAD